MDSAPLTPSFETDLDTGVTFVSNQEELSACTSPATSHPGDEIEEASIVPLKSERALSAPKQNTSRGHPDGHSQMASILSEAIIEVQSLSDSDSDGIDEEEIEPAQKEIRESAVMATEKEKPPAQYTLDGEEFVLETGLSTSAAIDAVGRAQGMDDMKELLGESLASIQNSADSSDEEIEEEEIQVQKKGEQMAALKTTFSDSSQSQSSSTSSDSDDERKKMFDAMRSQIEQESSTQQRDTSSSDESIAEDLFQPSDKHRAMLQHMITQSLSRSSSVSGELQPIEEQGGEEEYSDSSTGSFDLITEKEVKRQQKRRLPMSDGSEAPEIPEEEVVDEMYPDEDDGVMMEIGSSKEESSPSATREAEDDGKAKEELQCVEEITMEHSTIEFAAEKPAEDSFEISIVDIVKAKDEKLLSQNDFIETLKSEDLRESIKNSIVDQIKKHQSTKEKAAETKEAKVSRWGSFFSKVKKDTKSNDDEKSALEKKLKFASEANDAQAKKIMKLESVVKNLHDHIEELERIIAQFNTVERKRSLRLADAATETRSIESTDGETQHQVSTSSVQSQKDIPALNTRHVRCQTVSSPSENTTMKNVTSQITPEQASVRNVSCGTAAQTGNGEARRTRDTSSQFDQQKPSTRNVTLQVDTSTSSSSTVQKKHVCSQASTPTASTRNVTCQWSASQDEMKSSRSVYSQIEPQKPILRHVKCQCSNLTPAMLLSNDAGAEFDPNAMVDRILEQSDTEFHPGFDELDQLDGTLDPESPDRWRRLAETQFSNDPTVQILQRSLLNAVNENDALEQKLNKMQRDNEGKKMEIERKILELHEEIEKAIRGKDEQREQYEREVRDLVLRITELEENLRVSEHRKAAVEKRIQEAEREKKTAVSDDQANVGEHLAEKEAMRTKLREAEDKRDQLQKELDQIRSDREQKSGALTDLQSNLDAAQNDNESLKSEVEVLRNEYMHLKKGMNILANSFGIDTEKLKDSSSPNIPIQPSESKEKSDLPRDPTLEDLKRHVFGDRYPAASELKPAESIASPKNKTIHDSIIKQSNLVLKTLLEAADMQKESDNSNYFNWRDVNKSIADSLIQESQENIGERKEEPAPRVNGNEDASAEQVDPDTLNKIQEIMNALLKNQVGYSIKISPDQPNSNSIVLQLAKSEPEQNGSSAPIENNGVAEFQPEGMSDAEDKKGPLEVDVSLGNNGHDDVVWERQHRYDRQNMEEEYEKLRKKRLGMLLQAYTGNDRPRPLPPSSSLALEVPSLQPSQKSNDQERIQQILAKYDLVPGKGSKPPPARSDRIKAELPKSDVTDFSEEAARMLKESQSIKDRLQLMREHLNRADHARAQVSTFNELSPYGGSRDSLNNSFSDSLSPSQQDLLDFRKSRETSLSYNRELSPGRYAHASHSYSNPDLSKPIDSPSKFSSQKKRNFEKPLSAARAYKSALKSRLRSSKSPKRDDLRDSTIGKKYDSSRDYSTRSSDLYQSLRDLPSSNLESYGELLDSDLQRPVESRRGFTEDRTRLYDSYRSLEPSADANGLQNDEASRRDASSRPYSSHTERSALLDKYSEMAKAYESSYQRPDSRRFDKIEDPDLVVTKAGDIISRSREPSPSRHVHFSPSQDGNASPTMEDRDKDRWQEPTRFFSTTLSVADEPSRREANYSRKQREKERLPSTQDFRTRPCLSEVQRERANDLIDRYTLQWKRMKSNHLHPRLADQEKLATIIDKYDQLWQNRSDKDAPADDSVLDRSLDVADIVQSFLNEENPAY